MKKTIAWMIVSLVFTLSAPSAKAVMLPGQVTGYSVLGCMMTNFTGAKQIVDQVQYQYTCNHGPRDPFHTYFQVFPCFGMCEVENGRSLWHNNGPWTQNCLLINSSCQGWAHPAPTPVPTPSVAPEQ